MPSRKTAVCAILVFCLTGTAHAEPFDISVEGTVTAASGILDASYIGGDFNVSQLRIDLDPANVTVEQGGQSSVARYVLDVPPNANRYTGVVGTFSSTDAPSLSEIRLDFINDFDADAAGNPFGLSGTMDVLEIETIGNGSGASSMFRIVVRTWIVSDTSWFGNSPGSLPTELPTDSAGAPALGNPLFVGGDGEYIRAGSGEVLAAFDWRANSPVVQTVDFDNPAPELNGPLGEWQGLDFRGQWLTSGPYYVDATNHVWSPTPLASIEVNGTVTSLSVYSTVSCTLRLFGGPFEVSLPILPGAVQNLDLPYTQPQESLVFSGCGSSLGLSSVTYLPDGTAPPPPPPPPPVDGDVVDFDNPAPPLGTYLGAWEGLDFLGQWQTSGPYDVDPTNNIWTTLSNPSITVNGVLAALEVYATAACTLQISDSIQTAVQQSLAPGSMQQVLTGWSEASASVELSGCGSSFGVSSITYSADDTPPPPPPPPPPTPDGGVIDFDDPAPQLGTTLGAWEGLDFLGQWQTSGPYDVDATNNIWSTFPTPSIQLNGVLSAMSVYTTVICTLEVSDGTQTVTQALLPGSMIDVVTGWDQPSASVQLSGCGSAMGVSSLTLATDDP